MYENQLTVTVETVRALVDSQFPGWAPLSISAVRSAGTVNAIFRVGPDLAARFPLRDADPDAVLALIRREADAARELAGHTTVAVPEPVAPGEPGAGYPLPWSVQTWVAGTTATECDPASSVPFASDLASFIAEVRSMDVAGRTFDRTGRGGDLRNHDDWMDTCLERSRALLDVGRLRAMWARMRDLPRASPDAMTHGDLIPGNVLVVDGRLAGVLDTGGLGPADPALDLVAAWHLLDAAPRQRLRAMLRCEDLEWERGKAWAFEQSMGVVWYYLDTNPTMSRMGRRTIERILAAETGTESDDVDDAGQERR